MRKQELIDLLNALPGNPEIVLWNGFVDDYHHIAPELVKVEVVKHSKDFLRWRCAEDGPLSDEEVNRLFKSEEWEFPNRFLTAEQERDWYAKRRKKLFVLCGKARGKKHCDRLGSMDY